MATPKLRFKEFDADYTNTTFEKLKGFSIQSGKSEEKGDTGEFPFYGSTGVIGYKDIFDYEGKSILIARVGANAGSLYQIDGKYSVSDNTLRLTVSDDTSLDYLRELLIKFNLNRLVFGTGQPLVTGGMIKKVNIFIPEFTEQTKIASFLSVVDEKISQLTQKHELLSQYKQGMMQKLFSQEIRFKADDGREFGEWEEKTLIDSVDTNIKWSFTGGPFGSNLKSEDYTELGIRIIQLQNIGDGAFLNDYKIYTSPEKANELLSCNIYPDEILISKMGDPVARCCIVPKHHDRYVMCSDGIRLVVDKQNYSSIFMFYQINYQDFRQSASDVSTGSTRKRIGLSDLKQLPIKVPCLEEQTKIANFLSSIDQKIEVVAQQIEQAKTWKKGLLQQMFV